ncbi:MAG: EamA family transporter [candidate division Zixibacteria bacterium]|nr:EamA family transporter [candidate division Zixibacteria bacterium]
MTKNLKGYFFVLLGATLIGSVGVLVRAIYQYETDPIKVVTYRVIIATLLLFGTFALFNPEKLKIKLKDLPFFALYGFLSVGITYTLFFYAVKYTTIGTAVIFADTYPAWVLFLSLCFLNERLTKQKIVALLLTLCGTLLVAQIHNPSALKFNLRGAVYGLLSGLGLASYTLFGKRATFKYDSGTVVSYALFFGALFLLFFRNPVTLIYSNYPRITWLWIFTLAIVPTIFGYFLYIKGLKHLESSKAVIISTWDVVVALILAYIIFDEKLIPIQILGAIMIFTGILIIKRKEKTEGE